MSIMLLDPNLDDQPQYDQTREVTEEKERKTNHLPKP
jgi:hypothetical protein